MDEVLNIYKPKYYTPLEIIEKLRTTNEKYKNIKIGYAGRLDPMAQGVLLLMLGDATKKREHFLHLQKTYEFEILFGIATDTYDTLGLIKSISFSFDKERIKKYTVSFAKKYIGKHTQYYPSYASKAVNGKPLFWWAKNNKLSEIKIPTKEIEIYTFDILGTSTIDSAKLLERIEHQSRKIHGDFRQNEILLNWKKTIDELVPIYFPVIRCRISCSAGTYIRSIANQLGEITKVGALALEIERIAIGGYTIDQSLQLI